MSACDGGVEEASCVFESGSSHWLSRFLFGVTFLLKALARVLGLRCGGGMLSRVGSSSILIVIQDAFDEIDWLEVSGGDCSGEDIWA